MMNLVFFLLGAVFGLMLPFFVTWIGNAYGDYLHSHRTGEDVLHLGRNLEIDDCKELTDINTDDSDD